MADAGDPGGRGVALLLAVAAVAASIIGALSALRSNDSSDAWQEAVRVETRWTAGAVEDIRYAYATEGRQAFRIVHPAIRAEELRRVAEQLGGPARDAVIGEAEVQEQLASIAREGSEIAQDARYALEGGGYDIAVRLSDNRRANPALVAADPEPVQANGDRAARQASVMTATLVPVAFTFLFGSLAQAFPRRRRWLLALGVVSLTMGVAGAVITGFAV